MHGMHHVVILAAPKRPAPAVLCMDICGGAWAVLAAQQRDQTGVRLRMAAGPDGHAAAAWPGERGKPGPVGHSPAADANAHVNSGSGPAQIHIAWPTAVFAQAQGQAQLQTRAGLPISHGGASRCRGAKGNTGARIGAGQGSGRAWPDRNAAAGSEFAIDNPVSVLKYQCACPWCSCCTCIVALR